MGIGVSILLIAIGAILAFAVHFVVGGIDLQTVGVILLGVGALGLIVGLIMSGVGSGPRRRSSVEETYSDPADPARVVRRRDTFAG